MPENQHQTVFLPAVSSYSATYVRRMIRQAVSYRQDTFQKSWRNPLGLDIRSPIRNYARAAAN
jgi:hypothetical protein